MNYRSFKVLFGEMDSAQFLNDSMMKTIHGRDKNMVSILHRFDKKCNKQIFLMEICNPKGFMIG